MSGLPRAAEEEITRRLGLLTLTEKIALLTGGSTWTTRASAAIGLHEIVFSDGPAGVKGPDPTAQSTSLPAPTALAATWDLDLAARAGDVFAQEARRKGVDVVLAPVLNLQRTPVGGRHFESFSEDPVLTAQVGSTLIAAMQARGVGACAKHFVANDSETERTSYVAQVDMTTLREAYLVPFERAVTAAGAWTVMAAYNQVDHGAGASPMTEHSSLLGDVLKGEWQFDGVVVSDWEATRSTVASAVGGLDLVMPGPGGPWGSALEDAVIAGSVPEEVIDDKVRRLLRLAARVGKLDGVSVSGGQSVRPGEPTLRGALTDQAPAAFARELGAAAMVVLRRSAAMPLPLVELGSSALPESIAVLGANALNPYVQGGGSAHVNAPYEVSPVAGLIAALDGTSTVVRWARGGRTLATPPLLASDLADDGRQGHGIWVEALGADGGVLSATSHPSTDLTWMRDLPPAATVVRLSTTVHLSEPGTHELELGSIGRHEVWLDGVSVASVTLDRGVDAILDSSVNSPPGTAVRIVVGASARVVHLTADLHVVDAGGYGRLVSAALRHRPPEEGLDREIVAAAELAARSDVAIVVVGTNGEVESEGWDRTDLLLPGAQDRLVSAVLAANPRTLVVVNAGAPVLLPWLDEVPTVLWAWLPGQEFGDSLADVLLGRVEPSGRLPWTLPAGHADSPVPHARPSAGVVAYREGSAVGYRSWAPGGPGPAAPFGHGLGWADWEYLNLEVSEHGDEIRVQVMLRNIGTRAGREVVQAYVARPRAGRRLAGFAVTDVAPGRVATVTLELDAAALERWDEQANRMRRCDGEFELLIGRSVGDIRLTHHRVVRDLAPPRPVAATEPLRPAVRTI